MSLKPPTPPLVLNNTISIEQVVTWMISLMVGGAALTSFFYVNFETKDSAQDAREQLVLRLDRIENKLDQLIDK